MSAPTVQAAASSSAALPIVQRVTAVVQDAGAGGRLLYAVQYSPPHDASKYDAWVEASDFAMTDAQLQTYLRRTQKGEPVIVFDKAFHGSAELDRTMPIPLRTVLDELEADDDDSVPGAAIDDGGGHESIEDATCR